MNDQLDRTRFLNLGGIVEGGVLLLALGLAWWADIDLKQLFSLDWKSAALGLIGTAPMLLFLLALRRARIPSLERIDRFLVDNLGPPLAACRWYDLFLLALAAGLCEEVLFRGVLQTWMGRHSFLTGLILANLLFGLAHLVTPAYGVMAALLGVYLSLLMQATQPPSLLAPVIAHSLYDLVAFVVIARDYQQRTRDAPADFEQSPSADEPDPPTDESDDESVRS